MISSLRSPFLALFGFLILANAHAANTYVAEAVDFGPANPTVGATVTWNPGQPNEVTGLVFGTAAFTSIQAAVDAAVAGDTVFIADGEFLEGSMIEVEKNLILQGEGIGQSILSRDAGAASHTILRIRRDAIVTLDGLTITGGSSSTGGISCSSSTLTMSHCEVTGNTGTGRSGVGGIDIFGDTSFIMSDCIVSGNTGATAGGISGIRATLITVMNSTIRDNSSSGSFGTGGIRASTTPTTIINSTVSGNTGSGNGGMRFTSATLDILNSTVSGNTGADVGALLLFEMTVTLASSTVTGNRGTDPSRITGGVGGIDSAIDSSVSVINSIVAGNSGSRGGDLQGTFTDNGGNIIGLPTGVTDMSEILAPLADNGGPTFTHALVKGSPAIDAGLNDQVPVDVTTDQRGSPRIANTTVDIGAFEQPEQAPSLVFADGTLTEVWEQLGMDLDGEAAGDLFGSSVSLSADGLTALVGGPSNGATAVRSGHARVFRYDGTAWIQLGADLDGLAEADDFGRSVSVSADGQTVLVGGPFNSENGTSSGLVQIYRYDGTQWVQLGANINGDAPFDLFGNSVSLSADGGTAIIGAPLNDENGNFAGQTRIFRYDGVAWTQLGNSILGEAAGDFSGSVSLSADGQTAIIGAPGNDGNGSNSGNARVFSYNGSAWIQLGESLVGERENDNFGQSVSLSADGETAIIGTTANDENGIDSGHARVFRYDGSAWQQLGSDIDGEAEGDNSGQSVSLSADGETAIIGARLNDGAGTNFGHARIFRFDDTEWIQLGEDIDGESEADFSGSAVSLSADGETAIIGATSNDGGGDNSGHARIFRFNSTRSYSIAEKTFAITDVNATDERDAEGSGLTYSLSGVDSGLFTVDAVTGELAFATAPDFETPGDEGLDGTHQFQVIVTDSAGLSDTQNIEITVTDRFDIVSSDPAMDATDLIVGQTITLTFDRDITAGSGNILVKSTVDDSVLQTIAIGDATLSGTILSFILDGSITPASGFYLEIPEGVITGPDSEVFSLSDPGALAFRLCPAEIYVDGALDLTPASPAAGDLVTWKAGTPEAVTDLTFGFNAFSSVQAAVDAVCDGGTVFIAEGTYLEGAQIEIDRSLTLQGSGAEITILSGNEAHRVISIIAGPAKQVVINDLWIRDGFLPGAFGGNPGTGIFVQANADLEVNRLVISDHVNDGGGGGAGIYHAGDELVVNECLIRDNTVYLQQGGGIYVRAGTALIYRTTISGNLVTLPPDREPDFFGSGSGGGIQINGAQVTLIESSIANNSVPLGNGGGISGFNFDSEVTIIDSSISNNTADQRGGGISWSGANALTLVNSTISGNVLIGSNLNTEFGGGGIFLGTYTGGTSQFHLINSTITNNQSPRSKGGIDRITNRLSTPGTIHNCVIAGNIDGDGIDDVPANWFTGSNNIIDLPVGVSDISDILVSLADNGGPTLTHALVPGGPAVDTGVNTEIPVEVTSDQRGAARISNGTVDIGAFELQPLPTLVSSEPAADSVGVPLDAMITLTFDQEMVAGSGAINLRRGDTDEIVPASVLISGPTVTITPTNNLPDGIRIYLEIEPDALSSTFNDAFAGIDDPVTLGFATCSLEVYVDDAADFSPANPATGDLVTWKVGTPEAVANLTFGIDAFTSVQAGVNAACEGGTVFIAEGEFQEGSTIVIEKDLTLQGEGAALSVLSRDADAVAHSVLRIEGGADVCVDGLTITGGRSTAGASGGGIDCHFSTVKVSHCTVSGNRSGGQASGGGIGGFSDINSSDRITIENCFLIGNISTGSFSGGAIGGRELRYTVTNSTFVENQSVGSQSSAGIGGRVTSFIVVNCTVTGNLATGFNSSGGIGTENALYTVSNTIVVGNRATGSRSFDEVKGDYGEFVDGPFPVPGRFTDNGGNLIGVPNGLSIGQIFAPLADNGGPTLTHALVPGSPAINAGANSEIPAGVAFDQRGAGFPRILGGTVDIGAFEGVPLFAPEVAGEFTISLSSRLAISDLLARVTGGNGGPLSLVGISQPGQPSAVARIAGRFIVFDPAEGSREPDSFTYTVTDGEQTVSGTIRFTPANPGGQGELSIIEMTSDGEGGMIIRAAGIPGVSYELQTSDDLTFATPNRVGIVTTAPPAGIMTFADPGPLPTARFYRLVTSSN